MNGNVSLPRKSVLSRHSEIYNSAYVSRRPRVEGYSRPHGRHDAVGNCGRGNFPRFLDQFQECSFPPPSSSSATYTLGLLALGSSYEFLIEDHWNPSISYKPKGAPRKKAPRRKFSNNRPTAGRLLENFCFPCTLERTQRPGVSSLYSVETSS